MLFEQVLLPSELVLPLQVGLVGEAHAARQHVLDRQILQHLLIALDVIEYVESALPLFFFLSLCSFLALKPMVCILNLRAHLVHAW